jgi:hypothetical protein
MTKTRKQSRRNDKKQKMLSVRNPFLIDIPFLPKKMTNKLKSLERIVLSDLEEIVS